jgi:inosine/xanthosine triphosphatase
MKKLVVASKNPVKINAVLNGFKKMFLNEQFSVVGISVPSEVSNQPMNDDETYHGAINRVNNASHAIPDADYWIGIEGGIEAKDTGMEAFAWIVIKSKDGKIGKARTGTLFLPSKVSELIHQGKELGEADDIVFGMDNSKQGIGTVGILTKNVSNREIFYSDTVVFALIPFINPGLY